MLKIAVAGAPGRMGRTLIEALSVADSELCLSAAVHHADSSFLGVDAGEMVGGLNLGLPVVADLLSAEFDCLIDFTTPDSSMANLEYCEANNKILVIGTTGFSSQQQKIIAAAANEIPIVMAPNMSIAVNLCFKLLKQAAQVLGEEADVEIIETHHRNKLDSPSGTALRMGEVIAQTLGRELQECAVYRREGVGKPRQAGTIGFASVRAGDVVGDHSVLFATRGERLEISHKASDRSIYAKGALRAAIWLADQQAGLYDMQDVLAGKKPN